MVLNLNAFNHAGSNPLDFFPASQRKPIREMIRENNEAKEFLVKNYTGFTRVTVDLLPRNDRKQTENQVKSNSNKKSGFGKNGRHTSW